MSNEFHRAEGGDRISRAIAEAWLTTPSLDLQQDARVALADGEIVGFADVFDPERERKRFWSELRADPAHPETWPLLLDFVEGRARELGAPAGRLQISVPERAVSLRKQLESRDFVFQRFSFRMYADLDGDVPEPRWPDGIEPRSFRLGEERAVYDLHEETFSEHPDHTRTTFEDWRHWASAEPFDPELWTVALAGGELQGVVLCRPEWGGDPDVGWISVLGVRRPWRGRGLGLALLQHTFGQLRDRGKRRVGLGVDAENANGVRLYERAGMHVEQRRLLYEKRTR
jgi:ribosomal protein S18 acetylase RimI-like enzyme